MFEWTALRDAAAYEIQVAERQDFIDPQVQDTTVEPHFVVDLLVAGPLWWRVRALDRQGEPGPWSVVRGVEVEPPPLAQSVRGIALNPTSVPAGGSVDAQIVLDQPAPGQGATVLLSTGDRSLVSMPQRVLFRGGDASALVSIKTTRVDGNAEVSIQANSRGEPRLATLRIGPPRPPPALIGLAIHPGVLAAGSEAEGMVTLAAPAPSKTEVRLSSSDASRLAVPSAVIVPAGANGASFQVRSLHEATTGNVTVAASIEGVVKRAALDLTAANGQEPLPAPFPLTPSYGAVVASYDGSNEFTWSSVMGAASYTIELSQARTFDSALAITRTVPAPGVRIAPLARGTLSVARPRQRRQGLARPLVHRAGAGSVVAAPAWQTS